MSEDNFNTAIDKIDLSTVHDLESAIKDRCEIRLTSDFKLASSFVFQNILVLIFQK